MGDSLKWERRYLDLAKLISTWSKDPSTKVGAVIIGPDRAVISIGFNGFPRKMPDTPDLYLNRDEKYSRIIHGEINALLQVKGGVPKGSTLYTYPFMPCDRCVVQFLQAGVMSYVAPMTTPEQQERWGASFERTTRYIRECGAELTLVSLDTRLPPA